MGETVEDQGVTATPPGCQPSASAPSGSSRSGIPNAEEERLRAALVHSMERFADLADIAMRYPWAGYPLAENFLRASAKRIERVLTDDAARYHDDIFAPYINAQASGIEARRAETGTGSVHESAVAASETPKVSRP